MTVTHTPLRALLVEDHADFAQLVDAMLVDASPQGVRLTHAGDLAAALDELDGPRTRFDVVVCDLTLPDSEGLGTLQKVVRSAGRTPVVVLSGLDDATVAKLAVQRGASAYLVKSETDGRKLARTLDDATRGRSQAPAAALDERTGLPNRPLIERHLAGALGRAGRQRVPVGVLVLDLDDFTAFNAAHGTDAGDALLRAVAERLNARVPEGDLLGRLEDDAFAIVTETDTHADSLVERAEALLAVFSRPFAIAGVVAHVRASLGIALAEPELPEPRNALHEAQRAARRARTLGGGRCAFSDRGLDERVGRRRDLRDDLVRALARDQLVLHYQPLLDLHTGEATLVEALVRWDHPERGRISPADFIPMAEETGLIEPIGAWALSTACRQLAAWDQAGVVVNRVAVNLSAREFCSPDLPARVGAALRESDVEAHRLELELTESMFADPERTAVILDELRAIGVRVAIDDFGTGFSSLSYLTRFAVDTIKVDGSFVKTMTHEEESQAVVSAIIAMGHRLGLDVVAECVETEEQLGLLRRLGCDVVQGHLFSPAMDPDACQAWMAEHQLGRLQTDSERAETLFAAAADLSVPLLPEPEPVAEVVQLWHGSPVKPPRPIPGPRLPAFERLKRSSVLVAGAAIGAVAGTPFVEVDPSRCPAAGDQGYAMCLVQKGYAPALTILVACIVTTYVIVMGLRTAPARYRRWRHGNREWRPETKAPRAEDVDDPLLARAVWGKRAA